jgi:hypothetical protein
MKWKPNWKEMRDDLRAVLEEHGEVAGEPEPLGTRKEITAPRHDDAPHSFDNPVGRARAGKLLHYFLEAVPRVTVYCRESRV